jgi:hypothetical protein
VSEIRSLREASGVDLRGAAHAFSVSGTTLKAFDMGTLRIPPTILREMTRLYGFALEHLFRELAAP